MPPAESAHKHDHGRPVPARLLPGDERTLVILAGEKPAFVRLDGIEVRPDEMFRLDEPTPTTISLMRMGPDGGSIEVAPNHDEANWLQPEIFDLPMTPGEIGKQLQSIGATRIQRKP